MSEVNDSVYRKAKTLAPDLYLIWHGTGHETPWEDLSGWEKELWERCAEATVLLMAPDIWDEGNNDSKIMLPVNPPRWKGNPYR